MAQNGFTNIVHALLQPHLSTDYNHCLTGDGGTALTLASQFGHTMSVRALLKMPDINVNHALASTGMNALTSATHYGKRTVWQQKITQGGVAFSVSRIDPAVTFAATPHVRGAHTMGVHPHGVGAGNGRARH